MNDGGSYVYVKDNLFQKSKKSIVQKQNLEKFYKEIAKMINFSTWYFTKIKVLVKNWEFRRICEKSLYEFPTEWDYHEG